MRNPNADTAGEGKSDPAPTGAEKGLAEAERRFGKQHPSPSSARPARPGAEKGLAEAERRFGKRCSSEGTAPDTGAEKGSAEARRRFGPPGDAA